MQQNNTPLDKGRVATVIERYQTNQLDQNGNPIMKNRYATIGRATLWPSEQGSDAPNVQIDIDTIPIGKGGTLKLYIFWESDNQAQQAPQGNNYQQNGYTQNNEYRNRRG